MKLKIIVDAEVTHSEVTEIGLQLEALGHSVTYPAGLAGRTHLRHSIDGQVLTTSITSP